MKVSERLKLNFAPFVTAFLFSFWHQTADLRYKTEYLNSKIKTFGTFKILLFFTWGIWFIDYLTTFVAILFFHATESVPLSAFFYAHWWGWIVYPILTFIAISFLTGIFYWAGKQINKIPSDIKLGFLPPLFLVFVAWYVEVPVIIGNIGVIVGAMGL